MNTGAKHVSSLAFDALALGALPPDEAQRVARHLDECPPCKATHDERQALAARFASEVLPRSLPILREKLGTPPRRRPWGWPLFLAPVAVAAVLTMVMVDRSPAPSVLPESGEVAEKGGVGLTVFVRQGEKVSRLSPGDTLSPGDALRFVLFPAGKRHVLIASVDGAGRATAYYPFGEWRSVAVAGKSRIEIPGSIVLDDSAGPERIFAFVSSGPVDGEQVRAALESLAHSGPAGIRSTANVPVPGAESSSVLFEKRERTP